MAANSSLLQRNLELANRKGKLHSVVTQNTIHDDNDNVSSRIQLRQENPRLFDLNIPQEKPWEEPNRPVSQLRNISLSKVAAIPVMERDNINLVGRAPYFQDETQNPSNGSSFQQWPLSLVHNTSVNKVAGRSVRNRETIELVEEPVNQGKQRTHLGIKPALPAPKLRAKTKNCPTVTLLSEILLPLFQVQNTSIDKVAARSVTKSKNLDPVRRGKAVDGETEVVLALREPRDILRAKTQKRSIASHSIEQQLPLSEFSGSSINKVAARSVIENKNIDPVQGAMSMDKQRRMGAANLGVKIPTHYNASCQPLPLFHSQNPSTINTVAAESVKEREKIDMVGRQTNAANRRKGKSPALGPAAFFEELASCSRKRKLETYVSNNCEDTASLMVVGCKRCHTPVMISEEEPQCPQCLSSTFLVSL